LASAYCSSSRGGPTACIPIDSGMEGQQWRGIILQDELKWCIQQVNVTDLLPCQCGKRHGGIRKWICDATVDAKQRSFIKNYILY
jgi:hypothetical protein